MTRDHLAVTRQDIDSGNSLFDFMGGVLLYIFV
jgi:hypothetical protein